MATLSVSVRLRFVKRLDVVKECACGCGRFFVVADERKRPRRFIHGHNARKPDAELRSEARKSKKREFARKWYLANKLRVQRRNELRVDTKREYDRQWSKNNAMKCREKVARRRALKVAATGSHTSEQWLARVDVHGWLCRYCGKKLTTATLTQDHVIPLSKGGTEWPANLVPACRRCNNQKSNKPLAEFLEELHG